MRVWPAVMVFGMVVGGVLGVVRGEAVEWESAVMKGKVKGEVILPEGGKGAAGGAMTTVVYLKNLGMERVGTEGDETILADWKREGVQVVVLDYGKDSRAVGVGMNADINKLRQDVTGKKFLEGRVDLAKMYVVPEGCRIKRDVVFYEEGVRKWGMDVFYPSRGKGVAAKAVPVLMEITCDNANRMGAGSMAFCRDTLIEGGLMMGFAGAMVDHPVAAPYKGMFEMPGSLVKMKAAVRTLRSEGEGLGLSGKVGVIGFSRGSPLAALLAVTNGRKEFEVGGMHLGVLSDVQAALIHGERYDFMALTEVDGMYKRFEAAWGKREEKGEVWDAHSAYRYVTKDAAGEKGRIVPMFLNTSDKEEVTYREQLARFEKRLTEVGVEHVYQVDADGRGHQVTLDEGTLRRMYGFFGSHLE